MCGGRWQGCADDLCDKNHVCAADLAGAVLTVLRSMDRRPFGPPRLARRSAGAGGRGRQAVAHAAAPQIFLKKNINRRSASQFRNFSVSPKIFRALRNDGLPKLSYRPGEAGLHRSVARARRAAAPCASSVHQNASQNSAAFRVAPFGAFCVRSRNPQPLITPSR